MIKVKPDSIKTLEYPNEYIGWGDGTPDGTYNGTPVKFEELYYADLLEYNAVMIIEKTGSESEMYKMEKEQMDLNLVNKNQKLKYKNSKDIPINAFFVQLSLAILFIATSSFEQVLMYAGVTLIITTTLTVISLFVLRYNEPSLVRPYKVLGYPFIPLLYLIANIWILYFSFRESTQESMVGVCIIVVSILSFRYLKRETSYS